VPETPAERVDWALRKLSGLQVGYEAESSCPHGRGGHTLFGSVRVILAQVPGLVALHTAGLRCRCRPGRLLIDGQVLADGDARA
jgi:hypothetical protein